MKSVLVIFLFIFVNFNLVGINKQSKYYLDSTVYFHNPGIGCLTWSYFEKQPDYLKPFLDGLYSRLSWRDVVNNGKIDFSILTSVFQEAYKYKQRIDIGIFFNLSMKKDTRYRLGVEMYNGKEVYVCYPKEIHEKLMSSKLYKPRIVYIRQSDTYWYCIDWRNPIAQREYKKLLLAFNEYLNEAWNGTTRRKYINSIQIRFWGFWGEGHNNYLVQLAKIHPEMLEDSKTMIKMDKLYEDIFPDIQLVAPAMGKESFIPNRWKDWALYEMRAKNVFGNYGLFIDHLNNNPKSNDFELVYEGISFKKLALSKWMTAPLTGEGFIVNNYDFKINKLLPVDQTLTIQDYDVLKYHINSFSLISNDSVHNNHHGEQQLFDLISSSVGYKVYLVNKTHSDMKSSKVFLDFYVGNMGNNPVYSSYWMAELVERDTSGRLVSLMPLNVNFRKIKVSEAYLQVDFGKCVHIFTCKKNSGSTFFFRVRDKNGIAPNMYLYNMVRTVDGEYKLN